MTKDYETFRRENNQQTQRLLVAMMNPRTWLVGFRLILAAWMIFVWPAVCVVRQLVLTGSQRRLPTLGLVIGVWILFAIAVRNDNLAGDGLFLLGMVVIVKAIAEWVMTFRVDHDEEPVLRRLGVTNEGAAFAIAAAAGLLLWPFPLGRLVGPLLIFGGLGGAAAFMFIEWKIRRRIRVDHVKTREAEHFQTVLNASTPDADASSRFQRVDID